MTALTILKAPPVPPAMPPELAQQCAQFDGMDLVRGTVPVVVVEQAKAHLARLERYHAPASPGITEAWCRMLRYGTVAIDEKEFTHRLFAIQATCSDLPAWVWTEETMKLAWRQCEFFPTANKLFEILDDLAQRGKRGLSQVRMLAAARSDGVPAPSPAAQKSPDTFKRRGGAASLSEIIGGGNAG